MTLAQVVLVRASFPRVLIDREASAGCFYNRLFELDPSLRPLFKGDMKQQGLKFILMLEIVVGGLNVFEDVVSELRELGKRHIEYGVLPGHYLTVREALLWMLNQVLGKDFTAETHRAWIEMYDLLSRAMVELPAKDEGS